MPANARVLREPAVSFSQYQNEQISTSRPSPKSTVAGEKDTAKQASFEGDKKVLVFGTSSDETDEPYKAKEKIRTSSPMKRDANNNNDANSAKTKSAEQSDKTRKTSRDQSVSKERRASCSRSASSASSENRPANIQQSKKRVQKGDKKQPESSTDDSSSESDKDELNSQSLLV